MPYKILCKIAVTSSLAVSRMKTKYDGSAKDLHSKVFEVVKKHFILTRCFFKFTKITIDVPGLQKIFHTTIEHDQTIRGCMIQAKKFIYNMNHPLSPSPIEI